MTKHAVYNVAEFKAAPDGDTTGEFEAIVSVFGNVDHIGDRVAAGAFTKSLAEWRASGDPIPVIWSHQWGDPNAHIGSVDPNTVEETTVGLKVRGALDTHRPFASMVYDLLKARRVKEFSFAYDVVRESKADDGANDLLELNIIEVGPTLKGMNPSTELLGVKADLDLAAKAGRAISTKNESLLRDARRLYAEADTAIGMVLETLGEMDDDAEAKSTDDDKAPNLLDLRVAIAKVSDM